jgi:hypothetical protein
MWGASFLWFRRKVKHKLGAGAMRGFFARSSGWFFFAFGGGILWLCLRRLVFLFLLVWFCLRRWPFLVFLLVWLWLWRRHCFGVPTALVFSFLIDLLAFPLCGGALTFFAAAKKVSKESGLKPLIFKRLPWLGGAGGLINGSHRGPLVSVTQPSSAPTPHCVRRGWVCQGNRVLRLRVAGAIGFASARRRKHRWVCEVPRRRA